MIWEHSGKSLSSGYLLPFEIVSVHLLVVLIGAAYLARAKRRVESPARDGGGAQRLCPDVRIVHADN